MGFRVRGLCCAQAERSVESLFTELASTGLVARVPPGAALSGHLGGCHLAGGALARAGADPGASPQQLRGALAEFCALPLLSAAVAARRVAAPPSRRAPAKLRGAAVKQEQRCGLGRYGRHANAAAQSAHAVGAGP